jgi:hypothetical protein
MGLPLLAIGASLIGGLAQASAAKSAARSQSRAADQQLALQERIYDETSANFDPYRQTGLGGFNALAFETGLGERPEGYRGFEATPGYDFMVNEGQRAIEGSAAASGNVLSGATLKALQDRRMGVAGQEYNNYLARLGGVAQMGQAAAGNQAAAGANFAAGAGNALAAKGNAQSAGAIGVGNAVSSGINNALSAYQFGQVMQQPGGFSGGAGR